MNLIIMAVALAALATVAASLFGLVWLSERASDPERLIAQSQRRPTHD